MRMIHTTFYTGSKLRLIFKSGEVVIVKYKQKVGQRWIRFFDYPDVEVTQIRALNYYKPLAHERPS